MIDYAVQKEEIRAQIKFLEDELQRAKAVLNANIFDCTTAPFLLVYNYRVALKAHIKVLKENLDY